MPRPHPLALPAITAAVAALAMGWAGLTGFGWNDYENEALDPMRALLAGDVGAFFAGAPAYGGSLLIRSPAALLASLAGGGDLAVYRAMALPCLLAGAAFGVVLLALRARRQSAARWSLLVVALAVANPLVLRALEIGHPEELLGGALCAGAVLAAIERRPTLAGVLLGLALANKAWAVLAIGPVLVALPDRRARTLAIALGLAGLATAPFLVAAADRMVEATAATTSTIFQPWQIWWFLGDLGAPVIGGMGVEKPGYRTPPAIVPHIAHPMIAALVVPATLVWLRRARRASRPAEDALLLLAFLLLLRCVLDPWNIGYYHVPFLMALLAWESLRFARPPVLSLGAGAVVWAVCETLPRHLPADAQAAVYLAVALPAALALAWVTFALPLPKPLVRQLQPAPVSPSA